jgi:hypothetical protein
VKFLRVASWGASERAVRMHPPTPGFAISDGDSDEMTLRLQPSAQPRSLVFYATFDEETIDLSILGDGVEMVWSLDADFPGGAPTPLKTLQIDPAITKSRRSWMAATVDVPPLDRPRTLRLTVNAGKAGNPSYDRVLVTCGEEAAEIIPAPIASPAGKANDSP